MRVFDSQNNHAEPVNCKTNHAENRPHLTDTKLVTLWYFASLAEQAQCSEESLTVLADMTLAQLYQQLSQKYQFNLPVAALAVAVNHHKVDWSHSFEAGDIVAFIPPVAGG